MFEDSKKVMEKNAALIKESQRKQAEAREKEWREIDAKNEQTRLLLDLMVKKAEQDRREAAANVERSRKNMSKAFQALQREQQEKIDALERELKR
jgi:hypothetical protein